MSEDDIRKTTSCYQLQQTVGKEVMAGRETATNFFFFALIIDFLLGFSLDYQQILAYDWSCGKKFNRTFGISFPDRICRIPSNELCNRKLHEVLSRIIILSGLVEILMVLLLTVIGEREETHQLHGTHFNAETLQECLGLEHFLQINISLLRFTRSIDSPFRSTESFILSYLALYIFLLTNCIEIA
uniref:Bm9072, isoform d n=1 Tax=Brugia malayi TaxID=6279 RepID=A0A1I9G469_BRUMA|nr:Bm9072, isoform d [Brugia malayi]